MTRRRVVLDALLVDRRPAGVARSALELVRALASTDRGLDFTVAAAAPEMFSFLDGVPGWSVVDCRGARGGGAADLPGDLLPEHSIGQTFPQYPFTTTSICQPRRTI